MWQARPNTARGGLPRAALAPLFIALLALFAMARPLYAQQTAGTPEEEDGQTLPPDLAALTAPLQPDGGSVWSFFYGYGFNQVINRSAEVDVASAAIRWAHMGSEKGSGFFRGHPAFAVELVPITTFLEKSATTWAAGANVLYEHHFAARGRLLPIWRIGAGFLYGNDEVPAGETQHNFSLLTALGFDIIVTQTSALLIEYRFHHISNANTGERNPGVNAHTVVFGLSFYR